MEGTHAVSPELCFFEQRIWYNFNYGSQWIKNDPKRVSEQKYI